jgi:hypothetical protein
LSSESISRFLEELGQDYIQDLFFKFYHDFTNRDVINNKLKCKTILIDGTGAPNAIDASRTALSNHMENVKNEIRIINVVDKERGLPIFFKIIPGNILDKTTLEYTITILQSRNID